MLKEKSSYSAVDTTVLQYLEKVVIPTSEKLKSKDTEKFDTFGNNFDTVTDTLLDIYFNNQFTLSKKVKQLLTLITSIYYQNCSDKVKQYNKKFIIKKSGFQNIQFIKEKVIQISKKNNKILVNQKKVVSTGKVVDKKVDTTTDTTDTTTDKKVVKSSKKSEKILGDTAGEKVKSSKKSSKKKSSKKNNKKKSKRKSSKRSIKSSRPTRKVDTTTDTTDKKNKVSTGKVVDKKVDKVSNNKKNNQLTSKEKQFVKQLLKNKVYSLDTFYQFVKKNNYQFDITFFANYDKKQLLKVVDTEKEKLLLTSLISSLSSSKKLKDTSKVRKVKVGYQNIDDIFLLAVFINQCQNKDIYNQLNKRITANNYFSYSGYYSARYVEKQQFTSWQITGKVADKRYKDTEKVKVIFNFNKSTGTLLDNQVKVYSLKDNQFKKYVIKEKIKDTLKKIKLGVIQNIQLEKVEKNNQQNKVVVDTTEKNNQITTVDTTTEKVDTTDKDIQIKQQIKQQQNNQITTTDTTEKNNNQILEKLKQLQKRITTLEKNNQQLKDKVDTLEKEKQQLTIKVSTLEKEKQQLFFKVEKVKNNQQLLDIQCRNVSSSLDTLKSVYQNKVIQLQNKVVDKVEKNNQQISNKVNQLQLRTSYNQQNKVSLTSLLQILGTVEKRYNNQLLQIKNKVDTLLQNKKTGFTSWVKSLTSRTGSEK